MNDSKPRIAIINDQPPSSGTGTYAWHLAQLARRSDAVAADHVYLDYPGGRVARDPGTPGESVIARVARVPLADNRPWFWRRCLRRLPAYDILHFTSQNMSFLCGAASGRTVVTCLDIIPVIEPEGVLEKYWRGFLYSGLRRADRVIAISEATKRDLVAHLAIPVDRIDVVPLGVGQEFRPRDKADVRGGLGLPADKRIVLHVGTAARRKRIPLLLESFARARAGQESLLVRIGRATADHRALAGRLGISGRVLFLEDVPAGELPLYYSAADLFVFPSSCEGFGLPPLEAMASGCPVVAADLTSIPEVVGDAGVLLDSDDPARWAQEIDRVLGDAARQAAMTAGGIDRARQFSWEKMTDRTVQLYRATASY